MSPQSAPNAMRDFYGQVQSDFTVFVMTLAVLTGVLIIGYLTRRASWLAGATCAAALAATALIAAALIYRRGIEDRIAQDLGQVRAEPASARDHFLKRYQPATARQHFLPLAAIWLGLTAVAVTTWHFAGHPTVRGVCASIALVCIVTFALNLRSYLGDLHCHQHLSAAG